MFTQTVVVLTHEPISAEELETLLVDWPAEQTLSDGEHWAFGGTTLVLKHERELHGRILVDSVSHPWPDDMGDPKSDPMLFGAWSMGNFGPYAFPGGLKRATEQASSWPEAQEQVALHNSFVRIRLSYAFGAGPNAKVCPDGVTPGPDLLSVIGIAAGVMLHPKALCYFNPNGEVVLPIDPFMESLQASEKIEPLDLYANVRLFNVAGGWQVMDSVGHLQFDNIDHEAVFPREKFDLEEVACFIRDVTNYLKHGNVEIRDGDTIDGPGGVHWRAATYIKALVAPPREIMCWLPANVKNVPPAVTQRPLANGD